MTGASCRQLRGHLALPVRRAVLVGAALPWLALSACVAPAVDRSGYQGKVEHSAQEMAGIIGSAQLAAGLDLRGRMLFNVTDTVVSDAEQDAQSVLSSLDSVQPPDAASVKLRDSADQVLQNAAGELADLRIAFRRHDRAGERQVLAALTRTLSKVTQLQDLP
jgi:hypothetical protein